MTQLTLEIGPRLEAALLILCTMATFAFLVREFWIIDSVRRRG